MPQLDLVSLGIDDPGKLAVFGFIDLVEHVAAFCFQELDDGVKIFDAVVDHAGALARRKRVAFFRPHRPDRGPARRLAIRVDPVERRPAPRLDIYAEVTLVPGL